MTAATLAEQWQKLRDYEEPVPMPIYMPAFLGRIAEDTGTTLQDTLDNLYGPGVFAAVLVEEGW